MKKRILCELRTAVAYVNSSPVYEGPAPGNQKPVAKYAIPLDWIAVMSLSFELDEFSGLNSDGASNTTSPSAVEVFGPGKSRSVTTPQSRMLGFGGPLSSTATRIDKFDPSYSIKYLMTPDSPHSLCHPENDPLAQAGFKTDLSCSPFNIESTLGIKDWLFGATLAGIFTSVGSPEAVSYEIKFVIVSNRNMTPTWKLVSVPANTSGAFLSAGRTRTHDLIITIGHNDNRTLYSHLASQIGQAATSGANGARLVPQQ